MIFQNTSFYFHHSFKRNLFHLRNWINSSGLSFIDDCCSITRYVSKRLLNLFTTSLCLIKSKDKILKAVNKDQSMGGKFIISTGGGHLRMVSIYRGLHHPTLPRYCPCFDTMTFHSQINHRGIQTHTYNYSAKLNLFGTGSLKITVRNLS